MENIEKLTETEELALRRAFGIAFAKASWALRKQMTSGYQKTVALRGNANARFIEQNFGKAKIERFTVVEEAAMVEVLQLIEPTKLAVDIAKKMKPLAAV